MFISKEKLNLYTKRALISYAIFFIYICLYDEIMFSKTGHVDVLGCKIASITGEFLAVYFYWFLMPYLAFKLCKRIFGKKVPKKEAAIKLAPVISIQVNCMKKNGIEWRYATFY